MRLASKVLVFNVSGTEYYPACPGEYQPCARVVDPIPPDTRERAGPQRPNLHTVRSRILHKAARHGLHTIPFPLSLYPSLAEHFCNELRVRYWGKTFFQQKKVLRENIYFCNTYIYLFIYMCYDNETQYMEHPEDFKQIQKASYKCIHTFQQQR